MSLKRRKPLLPKKPMRRRKPSLEEVKKRFDATVTVNLGPPKPRKRLKYRRKASGQLELFIDLFYQRGGISQISGVELIPPPDGRGPEYELQWKAFVSQVSHVLPKGCYRKAKEDPENLVIMTGHEHELWETKKETLRDKPEWAWHFELEDQLKRKYNHADKLR